MDIENTVYIQYIMGYYLTVKKNKTVKFIVKCIEQETIILGDVS